MSNVQEILSECLAVDGAVAAALADYESGMCLGIAGGGPDFDVEVAAAGNSEVIRSKVRVARSLGIETGIQDILITFPDAYHIIIMAEQGALFFYLALDRGRANLALARHKVTALSQRLAI